MQNIIYNINTNKHEKKFVFFTPIFLISFLRLTTANAVVRFHNLFIFQFRIDLNNLPFVVEGSVGGTVDCGGAGSKLPPLPGLTSTNPVKFARRESWKLAITGGDVSLNESRRSCKGTGGFVFCTPVTFSAPWFGWDPSPVIDDKDKFGKEERIEVR